MSDEDSKIVSSILVWIYIIIFGILFWNKPIGEVFVFEILLLFIYVVVIPSIIFILIAIILGRLS